MTETEQAQLGNALRDVRETGLFERAVLTTFEGLRFRLTYDEESERYFWSQEIDV